MNTNQLRPTALNSASTPAATSCSNLFHGFELLAGSLAKLNELLLVLEKKLTPVSECGPPVPEDSHDEVPPCGSTPAALVVLDRSLKRVDLLSEQASRMIDNLRVG